MRSHTKVVYCKLPAPNGPEPKHGPKSIPMLNRLDAASSCIKMLLLILLARWLGIEIRAAFRSVRQWGGQQVLNTTLALCDSGRFGPVGMTLTDTAFQ